MLITLTTEDFRQLWCQIKNYIHLSIQWTYKKILTQNTLHNINGSGIAQTTDYAPLSNDAEYCTNEYKIDSTSYNDR